MKQLIIPFPELINDTNVVSIETVSGTVYFFI